MKKLKQITNVFVVKRPYVNAYYYKDNTNCMYKPLSFSKEKPVNNIPFDSINLDTAIKQNVLIFKYKILSKITN